MGIRLALGSRPGDVIRLVVREGLFFPLVGLAVGVVGARAVGGVLRSSLYGIAPGDPAVTLGVLGILACAALVACLIPAHRATRVDPCVALRDE
jgi:ABC-type antimicrobial peptide transport system permease subunit